MALINVSNLTKEYKTYEKDSGLLNSIKGFWNRDYIIKEAVRDVSFQINDGEIVGYLGPNGSGKSTTMKILSGLLYPTRGNVEVAGFIPWERKDDYKKIFSIMMGQKGQLWWDIPAMDSFELFRAIYDIDRREYNRTISTLTEILDVGDVVKRPVRTLSLGERMRLELIGAFLHKPKIMYLDEPTIGLDFLSQKAIRDCIKQINKDENVTIMLTSHNLRDVEVLCNRVIVINKGEKVYDDTMNKLKSMKNKKKRVVFTALSKEKLGKLAKFGEIIEVAESNELQIEIPEELVKMVNSCILENEDIINYRIEDEDIESVIERIYQNK